MAVEYARDPTPWREAYLRCGIGHVYRGRMRQVWIARYDSDGEPIRGVEPSDEFDPPTCVVCGLLTYAEVEETI